MSQQMIDGFIGVLYSLLLTDLMEAPPLPHLTFVISWLWFSHVKDVVSSLSVKVKSIGDVNYIY